MNLSGTISKQNRQGINGLIGRMTFEDVRWPPFKYSWYVPNDSTEQESAYYAIM